MDLNEYQKKASEFVLPSVENSSVYFALGLSGETGEVMEKLKKSIRDGTLSLHDLQKELGDVLWYLSQLSRCYGMELDEVAEANLSKLEDRKNRGKISGKGDNR
jgi:NTP pyrophosphatase (non-canonical NTP hydrolase)